MTVPLADNANQTDRLNAHNRAYYRDHANKDYGENITWRWIGSGTTYLIDVDNDLGYHVNAGGVFTVTDTAVTSTVPQVMAGLTCTTLHATAAAQLDTTLTVNGASNLTGTVGMGGNATVAGTFGVTGQTNVGVLVVGSNASVGGTLGVTAATTLTTLTTNGLYTANAGLTVAGGTLTAGATNVTTLSTSGTASLHDAAVTAAFSVGGTSTLAGVSAGATSVTTMAASGLISGSAGLTISSGNTSLAGTTTASTLTVTNPFTAQSTFAHTGSTFGMYGKTPQTQQTLTGVRTGTLAQLQTVVAHIAAIGDLIGYWIDTTT